MRTHAMPLVHRLPTWLVASFVVLAGLGASGPAAAVAVEDLYRAEVKVVDKSDAARDEAFQRALARVLVKLSGSSAVRSNPDVDQLLESPERFVQQFRYKRLADGDHEPVPAFPDDADADEDAAAPPTQTLHVQFARGRIERALKERGIVIWGERRPELLVWLAVDDGDGRGIVSSDGSTSARAQLLERAQARGLPIMLPLMDMEDRSRVEFVDIQGGFLEAVTQASERYRANAMLVGHVRPSGSGWKSSWNLLGIGDRKSWQARVGDLDAAVTAGVDGGTDRVARAFAGRGEEAHEFRLRVTGVDSLDAYARVSDYLASLVRVRSADVLQLAPSEVIFRVSMNGRREDLERAIALGSTLARVNDTGSFGAFDALGELDVTDEAEESGSARDNEPVDLTFRLVS